MRRGFNRFKALGALAAVLGFAPAQAQTVQTNDHGNAAAVALPKSVMRSVTRQDEFLGFGVPSRHGGFIWQARPKRGNRRHRSHCDYRR